MSVAPLQVLAVVVAALGCGLVLAWWLTDGRSPKFYGYVYPRTTTIVAPRGGVISNIETRSGDSLTPGTPVARLADETLETRYLAKQGEIAAAVARLKTAQAQAELDLDRHVRDIEDELWLVQLRTAEFQQEKYDIELRRNMLKDALASSQWALFGDTDQFMTSYLMHAEDNPQDRVVTVLRLEAAENAVEVSTAQIEWCEWNRKRLEKHKERLPDVVQRSAGIDVLAAQLEQSRIDLGQLAAAREELEIKSTAVGTAGLMRVTPGCSVAPGTPIVDVLDDVERVIVVNVPSEQIRSFRKGGEVSLTFAGRELRAGRVFDIAPQAVVPAGATGGESYIEVRIEPTGAVWPELPAGSRVQIRVPPRGVF
ncbi:MAG: HlyD family efflux transporter periplasmic adaptor subunit [Planctomyces sp.]|nr:HlyD family efflux transporter periplasmic adaptor subunit [Planctomyces sp.]